MFMKKKTARWICLALTALLLCACAPAAGKSPVDTQETAPVTAPQAVADAPVQEGVCFTDMGGNEIALPAPATRIVALTPADVEILFAIGAGDTLVGCGEYCNYPAEAQDIPVMQTGTTLNLEQLITAAPEILLLNPAMLATGSVAETEEQVERLQGAGITVVISDAQDIAGVYTAIEMLGTLTGCSDGAETVTESMRAAFAKVADAKHATGKSVYFEISPLEYGLWAAGSGTFMDEIAGMLGLTNCFADLEGYGAVSEEQVIERDPDYIVTITMYFGEGPTPEEEILARPGWENVTAVRTGAVLSLGNDALSRPGPRLAEGAKQLSMLIENAALDSAA